MVGTSCQIHISFCLHLCNIRRYGRLILEDNLSNSVSWTLVFILVDNSTLVLFISNFTSILTKRNTLKIVTAIRNNWWMNNGSKEEKEEPPFELPEGDINPFDKSLIVGLLRRIRFPQPQHSDGYFKLTNNLNKFVPSTTITLGKWSYSFFYSSDSSFLCPFSSND